MAYHSRRTNNIDLLNTKLPPIRHRRSNLANIGSCPTPTSSSSAGPSSDEPSKSNDTSSSFTSRTTPLKRGVDHDKGEGGEESENNSKQSRKHKKRKRIVLRDDDEEEAEQEECGGKKEASFFVKDAASLQSFKQELEINKRIRSTKSDISQIESEIAEEEARELEHLSQNFGKSSAASVCDENDSEAEDCADLTLEIDEHDLMARTADIADVIPLTQVSKVGCKRKRVESDAKVSMASKLPVPSSPHTQKEVPEKGELAQGVSAKGEHEKKESAKIVEVDEFGEPIEVKKETSLSGNASKKQVRVPDTDEELFAAMFGDDDASVALREALENTYVGVDGLSHVERAQKLMGTTIHNPNVAQLPHFRPRLYPETFFRDKPDTYPLSIAVKEVYWRRCWPFKGRKRMHELWLFGVLPGCQSIDLKILDFHPYLYALIGEEVGEWDDPERLEAFKLDLNAALSVRNAQAMNDQGAKDQREQKGDDEIVRSVELVRRVPFIGYTGERRDYLLKITYRNMCDRDELVKEIAEERDMRLIHHKWDLDQLFLHTMQQDSPSLVSFDHPDAWKELDRDNAVRIARWIKVRLIDIQFAKDDKEHVTTGQLCGRVSYKSIRPDPKKQDPIPLLVAYFDGEMICQKMYDTGIDNMPQATNKRDSVISLCAAISVPGYSKNGSFMRIGFGVNTSAPVPGMVIYTFDSEPQMLLAIRLVFVELLDVDCMPGWNSIDFDMPYLFTRAKVLNIDGQFNRWNRIMKDKVRLPRKGSDFESIDIKGRWQLDLMKIVKKRWTFPLNTLRYVASRLLKSGANKVDMPYEELPVFFHDGGDRGRAKIHFYCQGDCIIPDMLDRAQNLLFSFIELANDTNTTFMDLMNKGVQIIIYNCIINELHHFRWYENKYILDEQECFSEPVPLDWDGWSKNNHLHQLFAEASDRGDIEPPNGFVFGDKRAEWRDSYWYATLRKSYMLGKKHDPTWNTLSEAQQEQQCQDYLHSLMYEDSKERAKKKTQKLKASLVNQPELTGFIQKGNKGDDGDGDGDEGEQVKKKRKLASSIQVDRSLCKTDSEGNLVSLNHRKQDGNLKLGDEGHKRRFWPGDVPFGYETNVGGNVFRSLKGVWEQILKILDFKSLYPSIMQAHFVCYSTLVMEERYFDRDKCRRIAHGGKFYYLMMAEPGRLDATEHLRRVKAGEPLPQPVTHSVLPGILSRMIAARVEKKTLMKKEKDPFKKASLDAQQQSKKIIANSLYGSLNVNQKHGVRGKVEEKRKEKLKNTQPITSYFKSSALASKVAMNGKRKREGQKGGDEEQEDPMVARKKARFKKNSVIQKYLTCPPLAYYVTSTGRIMIQLVKYFAEKEEDCLMVYGDTDSVMVTCPKLLAIRNSGKEGAERDYERAFEDVGNRVVERANAFFLFPNELEDENTAKRAYFCKKKMYSYWAHLFEKKKKDELGYRIMLAETEKTTKGLKHKKRDTCKAVKVLCDKVNDHVSLNEIEPVLDLVREFCIKLGENKIPLEDLAISGKYNPKLRNSARCVPHIFETVRKRRGIDFHDGDRIMYVIRNKKPYEKDYMNGEELEYAQETGVEVDVEYYFEKQLRTSFCAEIETFFEPDKLMDQLKALLMKHYHQRIKKEKSGNQVTEL